MKTIASFFILLFALTTSASDFSDFTQLFEKASLPYTVPEGAYMDYGSEEFEAPFSGKSISNEMAVNYLGASEDGYTQYEAVARIEQANYAAFVVYETSVSMNDGSVSGSFILYTLTKTGEYISSEVIGQINFRNSGNYFESGHLGATISKSEWPGDEAKLQIKYKENVTKQVMDGKYGKEEDITTIYYDLIDEKGSISRVTTNFE